MKLLSSNYFEKLIFTINCKYCQNKQKFEYTNKEMSFIYSCPICKVPQISINFVISEEEKNENNYLSKVENVSLNVVYNGINKIIDFNFKDSFDNQYNKIFEAFGISNKKDILFISSKIDISRSLEDNGLYNNCNIEIKN